MDKLSASRKRSPRKTSPKRSSSPMRRSKGLLGEIAMTPAHVAGIWVFVTIAFLVVCICVLGGRYKGLATRHFDDVDVDGRLRLGNTLERKVIVGYTPVFSTAGNNNSGAVNGFGYLYDTRTTSNARLGAGPNPGNGAVAALSSATTFPAGGLVLPAGYSFEVVAIKAIGAVAQAGLGAGSIQLFFTANMPNTAGSITAGAGPGNVPNPVGTTCFTLIQQQLNFFNVSNEAILGVGVNTANVPQADQGIFYGLTPDVVLEGAQLQFVFELVRVL